jgi:bifunctional non-homologous end joining protein LigD
MVMKRYPNGADGDFFFMKRAPSPRPDWIQICSIEHSSGNVIDFPMVQTCRRYCGQSILDVST